MAVRGALIEYSGTFLGPVPNIVVFQFNPEQLVRTLQMAPSGAERGQRAQTERAAAAGPPTEEFTLTVQLSAAEDLGTPGPFSGVTRAFGVGPQIAALEKMAYPHGAPGLIGAALDAIGDALSGAAGGGQQPAERAAPRESLPRLLFVWGPTRVLPVAIQSMGITEQEYDSALSPTRAEVALGLKVAAQPAGDDMLAQGALLYTRTVKDAQVVAQMARGIAQLPSIIPF